MIVVGLDISKRSLGAAIGDASGPPRTLRASFAGLDRGHAWASYIHWLRGIIKLEQPKLIACEAALVKVDEKHSQEIARLMSGFACLTETMCADRGVGYEDVAANSWRADFIGAGNLRRDAAKREAIRECRRLGWPVDGPGTDDKADACGVWAWAHLHHGQAHQMRDMLSKGAVRRFEGV